MSSPAITIRPEASLAEAARAMHASRVKRLPVVDERGRLVGILSRRDLLSVFLRPDEQIRDEIVHRVIEGTLWIDPSSIDVRVREGLVTVRGEVERRSLIWIVVELVQGIEGTVGVDSHLSFRFDDTSVKPDETRPWGVLPYALQAP